MSSKIELIDNIYFSLDTGGNLYFSFLNKEYEINITKDNKLELQEYILDSLESNFNQDNSYNYKTKKLILKNQEKNSLKKLILKDESELDDEDILDIDEDYINNFYENSQFGYQKKKNKNNLNDENYESDESDIEDFEERLILIKDKYDIKLLEREDIALYDLILSDINKEIILATDFENYVPMFRINLTKDAFIRFRPIGDKETCYQLKIINNQLIMINL